MRNFLIAVLCCACIGFGIGNAIMCDYWKSEYEHEKEYIERIAETVGVNDTSAILEILEEEYLK